MENAYSLAMEIANAVMKDEISKLNIGSRYKDEPWAKIEKELLPLLNNKGEKLKTMHQNIFSKAFEILSRKSGLTA